MCVVDMSYSLSVGDLVVAGTGNLYRAPPAFDVEVADSIVSGFWTEYDLSPFECINAEPVSLIVFDWSWTWARECGIGAMSVRGLGVRVAVAVVYWCGSIGWWAMSDSDGGMSAADRWMDGARTIGFAVWAPDGASLFERSVGAVRLCC